MGEYCSRKRNYVKCCVRKNGSYYTAFGSTGKVISDSIENIEADFRVKYGIVSAMNKVYDYEGNFLFKVAKGYDCRVMDPIAVSCSQRYVPTNKVVYSTTTSEPESKTYCVAMVLQKPGMQYGYFTEFISDSEYALTDLIDVARAEKYKYTGLGDMKEIYILSDYGGCQKMKPKVYEKYSIDDFAVNTKYLR